MSVQQTFDRNVDYYFGDVPSARNSFYFAGMVNEEALGECYNFQAVDDTAINEQAFSDQMVLPVGGNKFYKWVVAGKRGKDSHWVDSGYTREELKQV